MIFIDIRDCSSSNINDRDFIIFDPPGMTEISINISTAWCQVDGFIRPKQIAKLDQIRYYPLHYESR
jgi:hypothetical protein